MTNLHVLKSAPSSEVGTVGVKDVKTASPMMFEILELVKRFASAVFPVLILGETGTGKELIAEMIHKNSPRAAKPFVVVNCAAIPEDLMESEFFGSKKGSFSGSVADKKGLFGAAHGGTIFLDEIGEIPPALQAKLLRVLGEGKIKPVGSPYEEDVDCRVICATNVNLQEKMEKGAFRADLFYRVNVLSVKLPPLRERLGDIPLLVKHFLEKHLSDKFFTEEAIEALKGYHWPGNIRELEGLVKRLSVAIPSKEIGVVDLPEEIDCSGGVTVLVERLGSSGISHQDLDRIYTESLMKRFGNNPRKIMRFLFRSLDGYPAPQGGYSPSDLEFINQEKASPGDSEELPGLSNLTAKEADILYYRSVLKKHGPSVSRAARAAGMNRSTFASTLKRLGIGKDD